MFFRCVLLLSIVALCSAWNSCQDTTPDCVNAAAGCYSNDPTYLAWIRQKCPKTCNVCGGTGGGNCQDAGIYDCSRTVNGINFCNNPSIPQSQKIQFCSRTCNLC